MAGVINYFVNSLIQGYWLLQKAFAPDCLVPILLTPWRRNKTQSELQRTLVLYQLHGTYFFNFNPLYGHISIFVFTMINVRLNIVSVSTGNIKKLPLVATISRSKEQQMASSWERELNC